MKIGKNRLVGTAEAISMSFGHYNSFIIIMVIQWSKGNLYLWYENWWKKVIDNTKNCTQAKLGYLVQKSI